jgi:probable HAF family extracellular repeat protein
MRKIKYALLAATLSAPVALLAAPAYHVDNLPAFGGARNQGNSINDAGTVGGFSTRPGDLHRHATLWTADGAVDLGTLGGPNSSIAWPEKNLHGRLVGISQTATPDPLGENWSCAPFFQIDRTGYTCRGFVYEAGHMRALPTLGGNHGYATDANNRGQIVGWAETTVRDPTCEGAGPGKSGQVLQFLPVIYGPGEGAIHALPLLPGDSSGSAVAINDQGTIVGISGACDQAVGRYSAAHAVLWDSRNASVVDIGAGALTAPFWNTPVAINNNGDVVGFAGDSTDPTGNITHAFIWTRSGGVQFLSNAPDDNSTATGINDAGQVVGYLAVADGSLHAFVWDTSHGLKDLNDSGETDYSGIIVLANDINNAGVITGRSATDPVTGVRSALLITPMQP